MTNPADESRRRVNPLSGLMIPFDFGRGPFLRERYTPGSLGSRGRDHLMIIYQEKIAPPPAPLSDDEQWKLKLAAIASEDLWVRNFIERLAGVVRNMKR
jgi:hypothetical protein